MTLREHISIARRSWRLLYSMSRRFFAAILAYSVVTALLPYIPVWFSARLIDALAAGAGVQVLIRYAALTVGLTALGTLLSAVLNAQKEIGFQEANCSYEWMHAEKAMALAYASIEDREVSLLRERIQTETRMGWSVFYLDSCIEKFVRFGVQIFASIALTASFFTLHAIAPAAKLAFVGGILVSIVVAVLTSARSSAINMEFFKDGVTENITLDKYSTYIRNYSSGKDIRLYAMTAPLVKYAGNFYKTICDREARAYFRRALLRLAAVLMDHVLRFGVYLLLISGALRGGVSVGSIAQYVTSVMLLLAAANGFVRAWQVAMANDQYLKRFFSYFDIPNPMYQGTLSVEKRDDNDYCIEFRDVSFRYPNTETYALRHVSLRFRIGERLAVVGMNGSGKTTFIKLLCRLYDPTEGVILLNGVDIRKYNYDEYLSIFSVVFQDFRLFSFSLGQNVAAGAEYDRERAVSCLREAGFGERLAKMPEGLETSLYQDFDKAGMEISGGEAQKIALARALYKNAPFIVLDEPTAALDPVSEYEVYRKFNEISGGRTAVYISHRLASCRFCDEILVFHEGQIAQHGAHEALLAESGGKYAELWNAQAQYYTDAQAGAEAET